MERREAKALAASPRLSGSLSPRLGHFGPGVTVLRGCRPKPRAARADAVGQCIGSSFGSSGGGDIYTKPQYDSGYSPGSSSKG